LGKHFTKLGVVSPRDIPRLISKFAQILARRGDKQAILNIRIKNKKGQVIPLECSSSLMKKDGKIAGLLVVARDITEHKKAEEELQLQSEFLTNISGGVAVVRISDGVIVYANPRFKEMFGYGSDELLGKHACELNAPRNGENPEKICRKIKAILDKTGVWSGEIQNIKKDGTPFWCRVSVSSLESSRYGEVWVGVHEDITEHKRVEKLLRKNMEKYHTLIANVPVDVWTIDSKDNPIFLNPNVEKMFGFTPEEIRQVGNWFWHERTHPDDRERVTEAYNLFFARRKTGDVEYRIQRKDGTWIWIHDRVIKVYEKNGVLYADGITWEITEGKKTEKMLKEAVEKKPETITIEKVEIN